MPFYTWRDVQMVLDCARDPPWARAEADFDTLRVLYPSGKQGICRSALSDVLGPAFDVEAGRVRLVSQPDHARFIAVELLPVEDAIASPRIARPLWSSSSLELRPPPTPDAGPLILAFLSYKGGTGRSTIAASVLGELLRRDRQPQILLVDADLEAPGLTWAVGRPDPDRISLLDALGLVHDSDDWEREALPIIAEHVRASEVTLDLPVGRRSFLFLPAIRDVRQLFHLPLSPEHVVRARGRAWVLGDFFLKLGARLGVDAMLVDTRAGVSEMSSPIVLDPRMRPIIVTSLNPQAMQGTELTLSEVRSRLGPDGARELTFVATLVPPDMTDDEFSRRTEPLLSALAGPDRDADDSRSDIVEKALSAGLFRVDFAQELLSAGDLYDLLAQRLPGTSVMKVAEELVERFLPMVSDIPPADRPGRPGTGEIAGEARRLEYAEGNADPGMLPIPALQSLVRQPFGALPVSVVLGAKGSGKTFAWGQMVIAGAWAAFARSIGEPSPKNEARVFPLLASKHLRDRLLDKVIAAERAVLGNRTCRLSRIDLAQRLETYDGSGDPRVFLYDCIAERMGLDPPIPRSAHGIEGALREAGVRLLLVVDGIEDAFQVAPNRPLTDPQARLLRALLMDLPDEIRERGAGHLGLAVFVRRDLAEAAVAQNFGQFEARHRDTTLTWTPTDALRLPVWLLKNLGWELIPGDQVPTASLETLARALAPFWGETMGVNKWAKTANWVIAALSDLKGILQARDVVRLVRFAAERDLPATSRALLPPRAIRQAIEDVSKEKINELEAEIAGLKPIFDRLRQLRTEQQQVPFTLASVGLDQAEVDFLERYGLVGRLREDEDWYMPEIVRQGLGFRLGGPGPAKVLAMYRAARARRRA